MLAVSSKMVGEKQTPVGGSASAAVSNLSSALRQVNLGNSNTTTDQSNINIDFHNRMNRQQLMDEVQRNNLNAQQAEELLRQQEAHQQQQLQQAQQQQQQQQQYVDLPKLTAPG